MEAEDFFREAVAFANPTMLLERFIDRKCDWYQDDVLRSKAPVQLLLASRSVGKSTTMAMKAAILAEIKPCSTQVIVCPGERQAEELFMKVKSVRRVFKMAHPVKHETKSLLYLANESRVLSLPGNEETIRGYRADAVYLDEAARIPEDIYTACIGMVVEGGYIMAGTTPAGQRGWYYRLWEEGDVERTKVLSTELKRMKKLVEQHEKAKSPAAYRTEHLLEWGGNNDPFFDRDSVLGAKVDGKELVLW